VLRSSHIGQRGGRSHPPGSGTSGRHTHATGHQCVLNYLRCYQSPPPVKACILMNACSTKVPVPEGALPVGSSLEYDDMVRIGTIGRSVDLPY